MRYVDNVTIRTAAWIFGAVAIAALLSAGTLFVAGDSLAAIKILLFVGLTPGVGLFFGWAWLMMRRPRWYRRPARIVRVAFLVGGLMVIVPLMLYMPWAPARFGINEMPLVFAIIMVAGIPIAIAGAFGGTVLRTTSAWREGDIGTALAGIVMLALLTIFVASVIAARLEFR